MSNCPRTQSHKNAFKFIRRSIQGYLTQLGYIGKKINSREDMISIHQPSDTFGTEGPIVGYIDGSQIHRSGGVIGTEGPIVGYGVGNYNNVTLGAALLLLL